MVMLCRLQKIEMPSTPTYHRCQKIQLSSAYNEVQQAFGIDIQNRPDADNVKHLVGEGNFDNHDTGDGSSEPKLPKFESL